MTNIDVTVRLRLTARPEADFYDCKDFSSCLRQVICIAPSVDNDIVQYRGTEYTVYDVTWDSSASEIGKIRQTFRSAAPFKEGMFAELTCDYRELHTYDARAFSGNEQSVSLVGLPREGQTGELSDIGKVTSDKVLILFNNGSLCRYIQMGPALYVPDSLIDDCRRIKKKYRNRKITIAGPFFEFRSFKRAVELMDVEEDGEFGFAECRFMVWQL